MPHSPRPRRGCRMTERRPHWDDELIESLPIPGHSYLESHRLVLPGRCGKCWYCSPETPCYCCLQAEVEALRARNETLIATIQRQDSTFERQMEEHEELEALRARVQAVRDVCKTYHLDDSYPNRRKVVGSWGGMRVLAGNISRSAHGEGGDAREFARPDL